MGMPGLPELIIIGLLIALPVVVTVAIVAVVVFLAKRSSQ
ncbi:hypothetical protein UC8_47150 [Roseimaritima ulvae]|uniref:Uncharacterized protein n=1 Tax=Roseimaritima ulvae TaxID=980254 RepID=A0A5B9R815_9BACT|nr:hypothetical protein UC8_47150 [Roseimaritima ulvae]